mmetsp:Transcript_13489/g.31732  ORF Transcript_13489/g.31732 Transcript_13489/m.31732 type:complete len:81 (-) Transcript_13489:1030-1272(-)
MQDNSQLLPSPIQKETTQNIRISSAREKRSAQRESCTPDATKGMWVDLRLRKPEVFLVRRRFASNPCTAAVLKKAPLLED